MHDASTSRAGAKPSGASGPALYAPRPVEDGPKRYASVAAPKKIGRIQFGLFSPHHMEAVSELEIVKRELYEPGTRTPMKDGCLDLRLGTSNKGSSCKTCGKVLADCPGHFGHVQLELPAFHVGYFRHVLTILNQVCKTCARVLLNEDEADVFRRRLRNPKIDSLQRRGIVKQIVDRCRRVSTCPHCQALNGTVKKGGMLKIVHEPFRTRSNDPNHPEVVAYRETFQDAIEDQKDLLGLVQRPVEDVTPLRARALFCRISASDLELLDMDALFGRPEDLILTSILVPPVCIRPSVAMDGATGSNEDDITMKITEIIHINNILRSAIEKGATPQMVMEDWEFLQLQIAFLMNSELPGLPAGAAMSTKPLRGFAQRLKGKQGRFRGNLSGKRVDFSSRTVISPDPNMEIHQVAVPELIAKTLTYPERVNEHNIEKLRACVRNGPDVHPGANFIEYRNGNKRFLKYGNREQIADSLLVGDTVERHMADNDVVLFNRQPSLHRVSIMSHRVKVMPYRTFRFNTAVCAPYNADFDGDEMNMHIPQTEEARAEAAQLMSVVENICTPRSGEPLVAPAQDFLSAAYLLTQRNVMLDRGRFMQLCTHITAGRSGLDIPLPTVWKPVQLWTGKQVFTALLRHVAGAAADINVETREKGYVRDKMMCPREGYVIMKRGELLAGALGKKTLGDGNKDGLVHIMLRARGTLGAAAFLNAIARLSARFLGERGFSIGIDDVMPSKALEARKSELVGEGYALCDKTIRKYESGRLDPQPGCTAFETLEAVLNGTLSTVREDAGRACLEELNQHNTPMTMALCGSKGSTINISQMIACVGQQTVSGSRIRDGFIGRTLPHFRSRDYTPAARGFVRNSFFTGLTPTEFFFHTMGGREGLVDTAVKTAETGYMQRRLMKALEDLSVQYDMSVRNSVGTIVQFRYGDDGLDPLLMEDDDGKPMHWERELSAAASVAPCGNDSVDPEFLRGLIAEERKVSAEALEASDSRMSHFHAQRAEFLEKLEKRARDVRERLGAEVARCLVPYASTTVELFMRNTRTKIDRQVAEPGTAVGALAAQSIGEPGTQMTLKSVDYETRLAVVWSDPAHPPTAPPDAAIGAFIDALMAEHEERIEWQPDGVTAYLALPRGSAVALSPDEHGVMKWTEIEAVTRHPPINADGTNTLVRVRTALGREVTVTKSKSLLVERNGTLVPANGGTVRVGDRVPIAARVAPTALAAPHSRCNSSGGGGAVLDVCTVFAPGQVRVVGAPAPAFSPTASRPGVCACGAAVVLERPELPHRDRAFTGLALPAVAGAALARHIALDDAFGAVVGLYLAAAAAAAATASSSSSSRSPAVPLAACAPRCADRIVAWAAQYGVASSRRVSDARVRIVLHSAVFASVLARACGHGSTARVPAWAISAPRAFTRALLAAALSGAEVSGGATTRQRFASVAACDGVALLLAQCGVLARVNAKALCVELAQCCWTRVVSSGAECAGTCCAAYANAERLRDVFLDEIVALEEVPSSHPFVYDLTVAETRNMCTMGGFAHRDTFHFAGVASMNVTLGVPRIKEIINASKTISTPIITAELENASSETGARIVKGMVERTLLSEVCEYIRETYTPSRCYVEAKIDLDALRALQLKLTVQSIRAKLLRLPRSKFDVVEAVGDTILRVYPKAEGDRRGGRRLELHEMMHIVRISVRDAVIAGIPTVERAVLNRKDDGTFNLLVEGYDLGAVLGTPGIRGDLTWSNHVMEAESVLGIEAARGTIMQQIEYTMSSHGMSLDHRHVTLLADLMCFKGEVLGITRFGIAKMKDSVLMLASFEKTIDHLFDAAMHGRCDKIDGVSECIIMGSQIPLGTGLFQLLHEVDAPRAAPAIERVLDV